MDFLDLIKTQVAEAVKGKIDLPSGQEDSILGGIGDSILGGLKQSAGEENGLENIVSLFSGKTAAASSPVTKMVQSFFVQNIATKLGLNSALTSTIQSFLPTIIGAVTNKVSGGEGGLDIGAIISAVTGNKSNSGLGGLLGNAGNLLGNLFGGK